MDGLLSENPSAEAIIYQDGDMRIVVKIVADSSAVNVLKRTVYGTNGVQYQHTGQETKIRQFNHPYFFHLFRHTELIGIYCLDERPVNVSPEQTVRGFYGRYFAIVAHQHGKGYGRLLKVQAVRYVENHIHTPCIIYAYVEEKNVRSLRIFQSESFTSFARVKTFIFRRYAPTLDSRFSRLSATDKAALLDKLAFFYQSHVLKTFIHIGHQDNYFVLKEQDEIIAGVQANPVCWNFSNMPGITGWLMMHAFPLLDVTRRFFNPDRYQFVALEGIYLKKGREDVLATLMESVLAHFGFYSALLEVDASDPLNTLLTNTKKMGLLSGFQKNINTHVLVRTIPDELTSVFAGKPVYLSSFDFT